MSSILFAAVACAILVVASAGGGGDGDPSHSIPGITDLTPDNFDKLVNGGKHALVEFYAPWCGHCKSLVPELTKLGELLKTNSKLAGRVVVGKVNADEYRELGERFGVQGFPSIMYFKRGEKPSKDSESFEGARSAAGFVDFLQEKLDGDKSFARIELLDPIAKQWSTGSLEKLLQEAAALDPQIGTEQRDNYALYLKFMVASLDKGADYPAREYKRLEKVMASGSVSAAKVDEFARKLSVLSAFLPDEEDKA